MTLQETGLVSFSSLGEDSCVRNNMIIAMIINTMHGKVSYSLLQGECDKQVAV